MVAHRRNADKSTGPKSTNGKAMVRFNAVKHGLTSKQAVLADEDPKDFDVLFDNLCAELRPSGALQWCLFDLLVTKVWRLRRAARIEAEILQPYREAVIGIGADRLSLGLVFVRDCNQAESLLKLTRYEVALENSFRKTLHNLKDLQRGAKEPT